jgi:hypothetical protein
MFTGNLLALSNRDFVDAGGHFSDDRRTAAAGAARDDHSTTGVRTMAFSPPPERAAMLMPGR